MLSENYSEWRIKWRSLASYFSKKKRRILFDNKEWVSGRVRRRSRQPRAVGSLGPGDRWAKSQNPAKNKFKKIRLIDESHLCLQCFDKFWMWSAGNQKQKLYEFAETSMEKLVKSPRANLSCLFTKLAEADSKVWELPDGLL